jgi:hypothetical protein
MPKLPKRINPYLPDMADSTYLIKDQLLVIMLRSTNTFITFSEYFGCGASKRKFPYNAWEPGSPRK